MRFYPTQPRRPTAGRRAFTMIELLVSMAIFAMIATVLYASLRTAFKLKAAAEASVEPGRTAELTLALVEQDLASGVSPNGTLSSSFQGTEQSDGRGRQGDDVVLFTAADSPLHSTGNSEVKQVELTTMQATTGDWLLVRKVLRNPLAQPVGNPDVEVLCKGCGGFGLRFFDGTNWRAIWDSTQLDNTMPAAVEVTLTLDRATGPIANADGTHSYRYVRIIPLPCSTAPTDTSVNGSSQ